MDNKANIQKGLNQADNNFNGFDYDYFNQLVKKIISGVGQVHKLDFKTEKHAEVFGLHLAFYDQVTAKNKEFPVVHIGNNYDKIYIEAKGCL